MEDVGQLLTNFSTSRVVHMDDFFRLAAGCCLYLSAPPRACRAMNEGRWGEETEEFTHSFAHGENATHGEHEGEGSGLERLLHSMEEHYHPESNQVRVEGQYNMLYMTTSKIDIYIYIYHIKHVRSQNSRWPSLPEESMVHKLRLTLTLTAVVIYK